MTWQWSNLFLPLFLGALLVFISAIYVWTRKVRSHRLSAAMLLSAGIWLLATAFEVIGGDLETKIFCTKIQYFGITAVPSLWLLLSLRFTGRDDWISQFTVITLGLIPVMTLVFVFTNEYHNLVWSDARILDGAYFATKSMNSWYYLFLVHSFLAIIIAALLIAISLIQTRRIFRWQALIFISAILAPLLTNMLVDNFKEELSLSIEITPFMMAILVPVIAWGLYRLRSLDVIPIARNIVVESMKDAVIILDVLNRITDVNPRAEALIGVQKEKLIWRKVNEVRPEFDDLVSSDLAALEKEVILPVGEESRTFDLVKSPVHDEQNEIISQVLVLRDISKRVKMEDMLKESLDEKEILLKEVHHRVKNNLQVIISLLNLQSRQTADLDSSHLVESQSRIQSMAFVHEQLYRHDNLSRIDFDRYVHDLVAYLIKVYQVRERPIEFKLSIDRIDLDVDQAIPSGLLINELISNALKYAFPENSSGQINVRANVLEDNNVQIHIDDNGVGLPEGRDVLEGDTLGLQLVQRLTKQLDGDFNIRSGGGTIINIRYPYKD